jgi:ribosomal protein S18 acetylase RimI-like enzyme
VEPVDDVTLRALAPEDFDHIIARVDDWWGGRPMRALLPRLFFDHFHDTSVAAVDGSGQLVGFLVGFLSPAEPDLGYVHFIGVDPQLRGAGLGRRLHTRFAEIVAAAGRSCIEAVTSPANTGSVAFHTALGFSATLDPDHDGAGRPLVVFERWLPSRDH